MLLLFSYIRVAYSDVVVNKSLCSQFFLVSAVASFLVISSWTIYIERLNNKVIVHISALSWTVSSFMSSASACSMFVVTVAAKLLVLSIRTCLNHFESLEANISQLRY